MSYSFNNTAVKNITYNGQTVKKWNHNNVLVYSASIAVTYYVESSTKYTEEVTSGDSCLSPKTFTPSKDGYTFIGWREDTTASSSVLSSKVAGDSPITLYAVFKKTITLTTRISGASSTQSGYQYYNNSTVANPTFTVANPTSTGATFLGWSTSSTSTTVSYSTISNRTFSADTTIYSLFKYADATASPSAGGQYYADNVWFYKQENRATIYSSVDTKKYRGATLTLSYASCRTDHNNYVSEVYVSDGTNKTLIVYSYRDGNGNCYDDLSKNLSPTLTFSTSSGTKPIYLTTIGKYIDGTLSDSHGSYNVIVSSIKLLGRTAIG